MRCFISSCSTSTQQRCHDCGAAICKNHRAGTAYYDDEGRRSMVVRCAACTRLHRQDLIDVLARNQHDAA